MGSFNCNKTLLGGNFCWEFWEEGWTVSERALNASSKAESIYKRDSASS